MRLEVCTIDVDGYATIWNETTHKARKPHRCSCCLRSIAIGEVYLSHFCVFEGEASKGKLCHECEKDRAEFASAHEGITCAPSNFLIELQNCVSNKYEDDADDEQTKLWRAMIARIQSAKSL